LGSFWPGYSATWYPSRPVPGQGVDLGLVRENLSLAAPLWRQDGNTLALSGGIHNTLIFTNAVLPNSGRPFPDDLWNVGLGFNFTHRFDNGWVVGAMTRVGSASDKPFDSIHEITLGLGAFLRIPVRDDRDSFLLGIAYSPVGNVSFPLPLVAYVWNPTDTLRINIGLPFAIWWRPFENFVINMSYTPLVNVSAHAIYRITRKLFLYGGFEWLNEAYLLADREDNRERFLGYEKRLIGGARWNVWSHGTVDVNTGYSFDRYYGMGQNSVGGLSDRVDIAPGVFLGLSFRCRF
jgi:hypothetical protein